MLDTKITLKCTFLHASKELTGISLCMFKYNKIFIGHSKSAQGIGASFKF